METTSYLLGKKAGEGSGGTTNYNDLSNKPKINNTELSGNSSSSDLGLQEALVSGTNIKTINNTSLLGSGDITIGEGDTTYEINVSNTPEDVGPFTGVDTATNRTVFQAIYDDFDNVDAKNVFIIAHNQFNNDYIKKINIKDITLTTSGNFKILTILTNFYDGGTTANFAILYQNIKQNYIIIYFENDVIASISSQADYYKALYSDADILGKDNTDTFTPTGNYNPATKKYVDDTISSAIGTALNNSY